ncbi:MAG: hypothetical protein C4533_06350 [Candidatus Omnitrophota bacterium]|jgi:polysaccharide export outer membrane protein|nr:MAG: hypothetical protein C4533_06350 [Candidatus Omnitrophota bacterium]
MRIKNVFITLFVLSLSFIFNCNSLAQEREYKIQPNDVIQITVFGEEDLSITAKVSQDGTISYPLLGVIKVAGYTERNLAKNMTEWLGEDYLVMPQVSVFVKQYSRVSVLGQVRLPGSYEIKENLTLTQAIALAGGFTEQADISAVKIIHGEPSDGENNNKLINVNKIIDKSAPDIEISANDTIVVEEYGRISIIGQVNRPGMYALKRDLTVVEAIGLAGGFTPTASQNGTRIIRVEENNKKQVISVPVASIIRSGDTSRDQILQPGDTIVVPESFF